MINLIKAKTPSATKDTLVVLKDPTQLRGLELERNDRLTDKRHIRLLFPHEYQ